ncbi:hypothetical protein, partial [Plasmodium yoelii yoelii]
IKKKMHTHYIYSISQYMKFS